ncbi:anti-sigma regulatory factor (Ser/Thr protein kinase) [Nocardioides ginsengisegetis]|uniref:Anti-sigma regulatory factor (Ser/Thr protein kinase) n=1 Tax=Nocardioides ginsengisegetis TaxID=661491 RepID=A0A7W3IX43_9ACTN|nr:sensor histidine kinase [Nocardioides ginsengisegetis]MBA8802270.1 anti-sigma regulatory factor (Ser/Thr protein kinase) [Nocardioides ginsengisegetis]
MSPSPATHTSLFYGDAQQYAAGAGAFLREGLGKGHRGLVMAPPRRVDALRAVLGRDADEVRFVEDTVAYAPQWNAYRVLIDFAADAPGVRSSVIAEQTLVERTPAELLDYRRLEAAVNVVFAEHDVDLLCPYDAGSLPPHLLEIGWRTHGAVRAMDGPEPNASFDDPRDLLADLARVVPPPPGAITLDCASRADVAAARRLVHARGTAAGLDSTVVDDVALAVTEVLTNALLHGAPPVRLHMYDEGATWVCHVHDGGRGPLDPLTGVLPPAEPSDHGYGLWLARQLCTAVDVGNDRSGTHVRLHTRR